MSPKPFPTALYRKTDDGKIATMLFGVDDCYGEGEVNESLRANNVAKLETLVRSGWSMSPDGEPPSFEFPSQEVVVYNTFTSEGEAADAEPIAAEPEFSIFI